MTMSRSSDEQGQSWKGHY